MNQYNYTQDQTQNTDDADHYYESTGQDQLSNTQDWTLPEGMYMPTLEGVIDGTESEVGGMRVFYEGQEVEMSETQQEGNDAGIQ